MALSRKQKLHHNKWNLGQKCEIYIQWQQKWVKGKVIDIFKDGEGEWVEVQFGRTKKQFPMDSAEIRKYSDETVYRLDKWKKGAQCELFSRVKGKWVEAQIINIFSDEEGDWLRVQHEQRVRDVFGSHIDHDIRARGAISPTISIEDQRELKHIEAKNRKIAPFLQRIFTEKDRFQLNDSSKKILTWFNVMQCVTNELFPAMSVKLSQCVQDKLLEDSSFKMSDLGDNVVRDVLKRLMQRRTMNNVETNYLEGLFQRAIEHNKKQHEEQKDATEKVQAKFFTNWSDLEVSDVIDIYNVQKALKFGQFQRAEYKVDEFLQDLQSAEKKSFGETPSTLYFKDNAHLLNMSFYPEYMVNDNVFQVMACHFAVSAVVHELTEEPDCDGLHVRSVVVPAIISSRYDTDDKYHPTIRNIRDFLHNVATTYVHQSYQILPDITKVADLANVLLEMVKVGMKMDTKNLVIIFDRQNVEDTGYHSVHIFQCSNWSEMNELETNYFISFDFQVYELDDENVVRCWLTFGVGQRLRFYPEYAVWIIPHLFMRTTTMKMYKVIETLYGDDYKHGWRVNLDDKVFNKYYHIITGFEHISNNYHRPKDVTPNIYDRKESGLRDHLENTLSKPPVVIFQKYADAQAHDSDSILQDLMNDDNRIDEKDSNIASLMISNTANLQRLKFNIYRFEHIECTNDAIRHIEDCEHIDKVIGNLQKFQECGLEIDALSVVRFTLESIINAFDHMIKVHDFLSDDIKKRDIQNYISKHVMCRNGAECAVLSRHSNRTRERQSMKEKTEELQHEVDSLCDPVADVMHCLHCYILHENEHLYRLLSDSKSKFQSRFGTEAVSQESHDDEIEEEKDHEKEAAPLGINFGLNVLQWLSHGESPLHDNLRDEITRNPDSTIDRALYKHYEMLCIAKIKGTAYTLYEMLCLKLYSDTTELQALLRRAHWTVAPKAVRKKYYQWAVGLYQTHLYHATPIPAAPGKNKPSKLYHGLSQMFMMTHELPIYNGPFSTTIARSVATTFCKEQGLIWLIQSTFANPLRFCIGISMDWISGFKHEREVLLYNQFLPIQKTETFDDDTSVLIDHLMYSLLSRNAPITDPDSFYNHLGVRYSDDWMSTVLNHKLLYAESKCEGMTVIQRFQKELEQKFFTFYDATCSALVVDDSANILRMDEEVQNLGLVDGTFDDENEQQDGQEKNGLPRISDYIFVVQHEDQRQSVKNKEFRFEKLSEFNIPLKFVGYQSDVIPFHVLARPVAGSLDFTRIKSIMKRNHHFETEKPLHINKSFDIPLVDRKRVKSGDLTIQCSSDINIGKNVVINGSNAVLEADGAGIRITSDGNVSNNGTLCCNGPVGGNGGDIYIVSESFVNNGKVESKPKGQIHIFCRKFINNGDITAQAMVTVSHKDGTSMVSYFLSECNRQSVSRMSASPFYKKIGVTFNTEWIPAILSHELWEKESVDMMYRLNGLRIPFFVVMKVFNESLIINNMNNAILKIDDDSKNMDLSNYVFSVGLGASPNSKNFTFDIAEQFTIPCGDFTAPTSGSLSFTIFCKSVDDSFDFVPIHSTFLPLYLFKMTDPLVITESVIISDSVHSNKLVIKCSSDIIITPTATVDATGDELLSERGELRMISNGLITNKGALVCNGVDGRGSGDIYFVANAFVNDAEVASHPDGSIKIFCNSFINNGIVIADVMVMGQSTISLETADSIIAEFASKADQETEREDVQQNIQVKSEEEANIRVVVKFRPVNHREKMEAEKENWSEKNIIPFQVDEQRLINGGTGKIVRCTSTGNPRYNDLKFTFDEILWWASPQETVFKRVGHPIVQQALQGVNGAIIAYGQTASGKTWSIFGIVPLDEAQISSMNPLLLGLVPRCCSEIFVTLSLDPNVARYKIDVSCFEIYIRNEIRDLLHPAKRGDPPLKVRDGPKGVFIENLKGETARNLKDVLSLMAWANSNRTVSSTKMNATSSRSHCVMKVEIRIARKDGSRCKSTIDFCDLAGHQKVEKTGARGQILREAQAINQSLTALGNCVSALAKIGTGKKRGTAMVPFRDVALTHYLKDSLAGKCKTTLLANVSPHKFNLVETINTLRFASRCKLIKTKAKKNVSRPKI